MVAVGIGDFDLACTGSFPGSISCDDYKWTVPEDGVVFVYRMEDWPQGPVVPYPSPSVEQGDEWVEIDGRTALFSQDSAGIMRWDMLGTPEVIEAHFGQEVAETAPTEIQTVIDSWHWMTPSATPQPTAITTGSGSSIYQWQKVGEAQAGVFPIWAPDSNHLLVDMQAANEFDQLTLLDRAGNSVANATGVNNPMWLNSDVVVAYEGDSWPTQTDSDRAAYHTVPGRAISASDGTSSSMDLPCCFPAPNGHGAVAITRFLPEQVQDLSRPRFVVWQDGVESDEHEGVPVGWDLTGDKLLVIHPTEANVHEYDGWLEVLSWPGLKSVFQDDPKNVIADANFDPTGKYASYTFVYPDSSNNWHQEFHVIDLNSGSMATIPVEGDPTHIGGDYVWNDQGELLVTTHNPVLYTYQPDGTLVDQERLSDMRVLQASADGSTLVSYQYDGNSDTPTDFRVLRGADWQPLTLPFDPSGSGVQLAPDGSQVFASTNTDVGVAGYLANLP